MTSCVLVSKLVSYNQDYIGDLTTNGINLNIPDDKIVTLTARTLSGSGTITSLFRLREEW